MFLVVGAGPEALFVTRVGVGKEKLAGAGAGARVGVVVGTRYRAGAVTKPKGR